MEEKNALEKAEEEAEYWKEKARGWESIAAHWRWLYYVEAGKPEDEGVKY